MLAPVHQVKLSPTGKWHRRQIGNGGDHTACGLAIDGAFLSREAILDEDLCTACYTTHERDTGRMKKIEQRALDFAQADEFADDNDEITEEREVTGERAAPPLAPPAANNASDDADDGADADADADDEEESG